MKKNLFFAIICLAATTVLAQNKPITVSDIWTRYAFYPRGAGGFDFMNDGTSFIKQDGNPSTAMSLSTYSISTGTKMGELMTTTETKKPWESYEISDDETQILYAQDGEPLYRHSSINNFFIYNIKEKTVKAVSENGKQRLATLNPKGDKVAFVRDNNLFIKDLASNKETQATTDGKRNTIINGAADWVYEEEFSMERAFYWSPDGSKIAFLRFDETAVKEFTLTNYDQLLYPTWSNFKYPKAGEKNATVSCHIIEVVTGKIAQLDVPADIAKNEYYIPKIQWTKDPTKLILMTLNRHQNDLNTWIFDVNTNKSTLLFNEKSKSYVDIAPGTEVRDNMKFTSDGKNFLWLSESDGYFHIYKYDMNGKAIQLTKGKYDVTKIYGIDEKKGLVYFQSAEESPMQRDIYTVSLEGKNKKKITTEKGWNDAEFSKTFEFYVLKNTTINSPAIVTVMNASGKKQRDIELNAALRAKMADYKVQPIEFFDFKTSEGVQLNAWMMKPVGFDKNKKYPVLMHVYGGPNSQQVTDKWEAFDYWWYQMLAQQGYVVVTVDGRGTGARGNEFKSATYNQLGKLECADQIEGAKYLGKLPYIDANRIGIWGWSFGGYMSLLAILKGNDVFKTAIAVAPVTNWKWYDSIYTERFLTTPQENKAGYEDNSPVNFADRLKGNLLLVAGDADDNVHYQNSAEMATALLEANKQFQFFAYPNKNHSIVGGNARAHLYTMMTNFLKEKL